MEKHTGRLNTSIHERPLCSHTATTTPEMCVQHNYRDVLQAPFQCHVRLNDSTPKISFMSTHWSLEDNEVKIKSLFVLNTKLWSIDSCHLMQTNDNKFSQWTMGERERERTHHQHHNTCPDTPVCMCRQSPHNSHPAFFYLLFFHFFLIYVSHPVYDPLVIIFWTYKTHCDALYKIYYIFNFFYVFLGVVVNYLYYIL